MKKDYALKLLKEKINGHRVISYEQIVELTEYSKRHLIRLSKDIENKVIDSMLIHANNWKIFTTTNLKNVIILSLKIYIVRKRSIKRRIETS